MKSGFANKPVNYVSFYDSLRFSNWLNNGQGSGDTETGAYTLLGGTATPSNGPTVTRNAGANDLPHQRERVVQGGVLRRGVHELLRLSGGNQHRDGVRSAHGDGEPRELRFAVGAVTNVGAYTGSASPYGTYDQGGNVWEWNEQIVSGSNRGIRGGSWSDAASYLAASSPSNVDPTIEGVNIGFRVASLDPRARHGPARDDGRAGLAVRRRRSAQAL